MFKTFIMLIKMFFYLVKKKKEMKIALKYEKDGNIKERDELVQRVVPEWARYAISMTGKNTKIEVSGEENIPDDRPVVFIANHQSYMDIPVLFGFVKKAKTFVSKIEVKKVPYIGTWMGLLQCTFLDRKNPRQTVAAMAGAIETVKKGYSMVIFPEGTRSHGGPIAEFKAGSFKLAIKSNAAVIPVTIDGTYHLFEEKNRLNSGFVKVTVHPAVETEGLSKEELSELPSKVQKIIESSFNNL